MSHPTFPISHILICFFFKGLVGTRRHGEARRDRRGGAPRDGAVLRDGCVWAVDIVHIYIYIIPRDGAVLSDGCVWAVDIAHINIYNSTRWSPSERWLCVGCSYSS